MTLTLLRRLTAVTLWVLVVLYGIYKIVAIWATSGWPMSGNLRSSIEGYIAGVSDFQRVVLFALFVGLPILYVELWRRTRRSDRLIRVADGAFVQESAIAGFLRSAIADLPEVESITTRSRMIKDRGLKLTCRVKLVTTEQLADIRARLERAVRAVMAERMGLIPVVDVDIVIESLAADASTQEVAHRAVGATSPSAPPPQEPQRSTIDLSPPGEEEIAEEGEQPTPESITIEELRGERE